MQNKPANWDNYLSQDHTIDFKITVGTTGNIETYEKDDIVSLSTSGSLYETFGIGNCCARILEVEFYPNSNPPRQSQVNVYCRIECGGNYTSYIEKGTFYISKRETDYERGTLKLTCYDGMLKAERPFTDVFDDEDDFPMSPSLCVDTISGAIGTVTDGRTVLNDNFLVEYPVDEDGDMTLREMLGRIAIANAGNWIITDKNKLLLVGLNSIPPQSSYLIDNVGNAITFGGDHILV